ncbi:MAG: NAD-dependent epimerase/dehydratase family protein [Candidatus Poseidoniales archaeon]|nr:MAG: NAD-dependent epimerase/dehydratase family protein [Candidatus Poseidoniales archaeon]
MDNNQLTAVLGRDEHQSLLDIRNHEMLKTKKILITGANGSIGTRLIEIFEEIGIEYLATDVEGNLEYLDITNFRDCVSLVRKYNPDFIVNIAGLKFATKSEHQTWKTVEVNIEGTKNLIDACTDQTKVILTSTCKSCNPEIVYGATKLIAERMVLNSGGSIARFFNVVQSQGNVFEIWGDLQDIEQIKVVAECNRHFISVDESCGLIMFAMVNGSGRYIVNTPELRNMGDVADALYPGRSKEIIERRRGDRKDEIFLATSERETEPVLDGSVLKIIGDHDKVNDFTG